MNSYIQFISSDCSHWDNAYLKGSNEFLPILRSKASEIEQLRYVLDQSLMISELIWLYGPRGHEYLNSYAFALRDFTDQVLSKYKFEGIHTQLLRDLRNIQAVWFGVEWIDVDINTIKIFLFDLCTYWKNDNQSNIQQVHPVACKPRMTIPYLMHRNRHVQSGYKEWVGDVSLPHVFISGRDLHIRETFIGSKFFAKFEDRYTLNNKKSAFYEFRRYSVLTFISKTVLNFKNFDSVLCILAELCWHGDVTRIKSANFRLFYAVAIILYEIVKHDFLDIASVNGVFPIKTTVRSVQLFGDEARALLSLLTLLHSDSAMQVSSLWLFNKFFAGFVTNCKGDVDTNKVIELVMADKNGTIGIESINAFKRVTGFDYSLEAINLISRQTTASTQEPGIDETVEESEVEPDPEFESFDDLFDDDSVPSLEAEGAEGEPSDAEDDDSTAEDDDVTDDQSSQNSDEGNDNPDNPGEGDIGSDASTKSTGVDDNNSQVNTQTTGGPEHVEASDDVGIEIRFVPEGSETVESVTLREEIDQFLSEILANPPKKLSTQTISALTALQKHCIHLLSVETIVGILGMLVQLPEKFKTIKNSHGDNS